MAAKSEIEWTDATWNMLRGTKGRWFCTKVDPLCKNCYAETLNHRFRGPAFAHGKDVIRLDQKILNDPLRWREPRKIFVCSMTDLFHETVPFGWVRDVFEVMATRPDHTFQILTKREARMAEFARVYPSSTWLKNVWWGCSIGTRQTMSLRLPILRTLSVGVRWLSIEPLLEDLGTIPLSGVSWVVVGCESGHGARPMETDWVRAIRDQCLAAGVAFFFKQAKMDGKVVGRPELDGRSWCEFPYPTVVPV